MTKTEQDKILADKLGDTMLFSLRGSCHKGDVEIIKGKHCLLVRDKRGRLYYDGIEKSKPLKSLRWYRQVQILELMLKMNLVHKDYVDLYMKRKDEAEKFKENACEVEWAAKSFKKLGLHFTSRQLREIKKLIGPYDIHDDD